MREVVIAGYLRTAQTRSRPLDEEPERDWFCGLRADQLLACLLPEVLDRCGVVPEDVDDFIMGCSTNVGENWTYGGRHPLFLADLPHTISAKCIDQQCGSSMAALHMGYMEIACGAAEVVLVGGMEHMTRVPPPGSGLAPEALVAPSQLMEDEQYQHWDMTTAYNKDLTAKKMALMCCIGRQEMDRWAVRSHQRAAQAQDDGFFDGEILPLEVEQASGGRLLVDRDQTVRSNGDFEGATFSRPAFSENGMITTDNSSPPSTGASSMVLMAKENAKARKTEPLAAIRAIGFAGVHPTIMGAGPTPASRKALQMADLTAYDIDYWEINEAFSVVALNSIKQLGLDQERVNVMGGSLALGHPFGATGVRLVGTLARILKHHGGRYGLANTCIGGGQGIATIIENAD